MHMVFRTFIENTSVEQVFNLIANIDDYDTWLPPSKAFLGVRHVSDNPVRAGTTYTDGQGVVRMHGKVAVFGPHEQVVFYQESNFRALGLIPSGLNIMVDYILVQEHNGVTVIRNHEVEFRGVLKVLRAMALSRIKSENERILQVMKDVLEKTY